MTDRWAIVIRADADPILLHCWPEETLELEDMQGLVMGPIEIVPVMPCVARGIEPRVKPVLIINEEGKLLGLPLNIIASIMADLIVDEIVGNAILMGARGDELIGFTLADAQRLAVWLEDHKDD